VRRLGQSPDRVAAVEELDTAPLGRRDVHRRLTTHILNSRGPRYGASRRGAGSASGRVPMSGLHTSLGQAPRAALLSNAKERRAMWRDFKLGELFLLALSSGFASIFAFTHGYQIFSVVFASFVCVASVRLSRKSSS